MEKTISILSRYRQAAELYEKGVSESENQNYFKAVGLFRDCLGIKPDYEEAQLKLQEGQAKIQEAQTLYDSALSLTNQSRWLEAEEKLNAAISKVHDYVEASDKLQEIRPSVEVARAAAEKAAREAAEAQRIRDKIAEVSLPAGTGKVMGEFAYVATDKVQFLRSLGSTFFNIKAAEGYTFTLCPVGIKNLSKETESLPLTTTWALYDNRGLKYEPRTGADFYLPEGGKLDPFQVQPEQTRGGYIVFEIKEGATELFLEVSSLAGTTKWKIK